MHDKQPIKKWRDLRHDSKRPCFVLCLFRTIRSTFRPIFKKYFVQNRVFKKWRRTIPWTDGWSKRSFESFQSGGTHMIAQIWWKSLFFCEKKSDLELENTYSNFIWFVQTVNACERLFNQSKSTLTPPRMNYPHKSATMCLMHVRKFCWSKLIYRRKRKPANFSRNLRISIEWSSLFSGFWHPDMIRVMQWRRCGRSEKHINKNQRLNFYWCRESFWNLKRLWDWFPRQTRSGLHSQKQFKREFLLLLYSVRLPDTNNIYVFS